MRLWIALLLIARLAHAGDTEQASKAPQLSPEHQQWLDEVEILITDEEREYFLEIQEEFRRAAFIDKFWEVRDLDPRTAMNEFKRRWSRRIGQVLEDYGTLEDARASFYLLNGEPGRYELPSGRPIERCFDKREELEIWFYGGSDRTRETFFLIFYRRAFLTGKPYRIWLPGEELRAHKRRRLPSTRAQDFCENGLVIGVVRAASNDAFHYSNLIDELRSAPEPNSTEWVATFEALTTDLPSDAETFEADLELEFAGRNQSRTGIQGLILARPGTTGSREINGETLHQFELTGEIVRDGSLFETFRYRFDVPASDLFEGAVPMVFRRYIRPGPVEILLKLEDLHSRRFARMRRTVEVPDPWELDSSRPRAEFFQLLGEANAAAQRGQTTIRLVPLEEGQIQVGLVRFRTISAGDLEEVTFFLDDTPIMTKRRPPFSLELNLGEIAASHLLGVVARDAEGVEVARDEILINQGGQRFRIRLTEPRSDRSYRDSLSAVAQVEVADGDELDRVEFFLNERRVATLFQPPFSQPVRLDTGGLAYIRAVAHLTDGGSTEDVVFVNAPDYVEEIDVQYVELYATARDARGRPLLDLTEADFEVLEDGERQEIRRFEYVRDLSIHAGILLDTSSSMTDSLDQVTETALQFAQETIRPRDRMTLISFANRPEVAVKFTNSVEQISLALESLRAVGGTALYDSLVFALHYFDGVKGQKALLLLSDGQDESSRFDFEGALSVAQRAGVAVYAVGLEEVGENRDARAVLDRFARETGGRAFFIDELDELGAIFQTIQAELRSQYLIAYQSTSSKDASEFRRVEVQVDRRGADVRTSSGYYP